MNMQYKASTATTKVPEKMAANAPVKIGTCGTVGSLVLKEIEYFSKLELDRRGNYGRKHQQVNIVDMSSTSSSQSRYSFSFLTMAWRRKKQQRRGSSGFLPNICSVVEVAESNRVNGRPGFSYRILKDDENNLHI